MTAHCIDPDQFLDLSGAVPVSVDDVRAAWEQAYRAVEQRLQALGPAATFYLVFGLQGAGKSTWVAAQALRLGPRAVVLSGPLPSRRHRARALSIARAAGCRTVGVWLDTPFALAQARNAGRQGLARIGEETMRHVQAQLEAPTLDEGFDELWVITPDASGG